MSRRAPWLALLAGVLIAVLVWFFLLSPQREQQAALREETESLRARQQTTRIEIARLEEIQANELDVRAAIARLEQYVPGGAAQPSAIRQVQLAADAAGVEITSLTFGQAQAVLGAPAPVEAGTVLAQIPVTMVVEGGYFQVTDFLRRLESELPRAVMVDAVNVGEAPQPAAFPVLEVTLDTRLFTVLPAEAVGAPPAGTAPAPAPSPTASPSPGGGPAAGGGPSPAPSPAEAAS